MPSKGTLPHAKIEVGSIDTFNADAIVLIDIIKDGTQLIYIPKLDRRC